MLSELMIRQAQPKNKPYSLSDKRGLLLTVHPNGHKYWILRMYINGKERRRSVGTWPDLSLKDARQKVHEIIKKSVNHDDNADGAVFKDVAAEWLKVRMADKKQSYIRTIKLRLNKFILPQIGDMKLADVTSPVVLQLCRDIEERGIVETASRVKQIIGAIFKFAIASGKADYDPTAALAGALRTRQERHMPTITEPDKIAVLFAQMKNYPYEIVRIALLFSIYTFARPGEIRQAEWKEIDFDNALWKIAADKMKMKRPHIVPLPSQVIELLKELHKFTGRQKWLFPSARLDGRCMSANTVRVALRALGYSKDEIVPHGFRSMASTILNEQGWPPDVIERQLAHVERNKVRAAYNRAEYLAERREMMQAWTDWLNNLHI